MSKSAGHYSGWVKRSAATGRFTAPIGQTTTGRGFKVVKFATPRRIDDEKLSAALASGRFAKGAREPGA
ncbi:hypothetical protein [Brevundimonas sp. M20]|uniref:hypothetical protein n=1 Tax=Brevundimonas sp. M20 TaxID=2591463 RepID=UPI0011477EF1|nr:hypothetical protein [Brevundimonas sp. M20]QDH73952.1 hypothetical protein FKQ52_11295 [Brevundimonas sp. M20]